MNLKMVLIYGNVCEMTDVESSYTDFVSSGRTGRRNALPDIMDSTANVDTGELTTSMEGLEVKTGETSGGTETQVSTNQTESPSEDNRSSSS
uniref:cAMP-dependent protein kinase inhibitor alpha n=1 Tax=Callorhinchus milii TaxID=7868 RepID=A0A4W3IVK3_CALMI